MTNSYTSKFNTTLILLPPTYTRCAIIRYGYTCIYGSCPHGLVLLQYLLPPGQLPSSFSARHPDYLRSNQSR